MEITKTDRKQLVEIIRLGIMRRCEEWLAGMQELIAKEYEGNENAFDRCMDVTKRSRTFFKEAMQREDYYRNSMIVEGTLILLSEGYLKPEDLILLRDDLRQSLITAAKNF